MKRPIESKQCSHFLQTASRHLVRSWVLVNVVAAVNAASPTIQYQPQSQRVILYQQAAFGVIASGTAPLFYQWRKDGLPIVGATSDQIVLAHAQCSDAGRYSVVVSNAESSLTGAEAVLTVNPPKSGDVDCSFACGSSINGTVGSIAVQPDGKVLIAGDFSTVNGAVRSGIARLNPDGTTDYTFVNAATTPEGSLVHPGISSVVVQTDGKILIGGYFNGAFPNSHICDVGNAILSLNANGTVDANFQSWKTGLSPVSCPSVTSVAVQSDGRVIIGGRYPVGGGAVASFVARLNADGTLDTGFQNGSFSAFGSISSVAVQSDGKVLIGGQFTTVNGVSRTNIARLNADGTLDGSFQNELSGVAGVDYPVNSIALQSDGKVLIGGEFTSVNGVIRNRIARLNKDGTVDGGFQNGLSGADYNVYSVAVQNDGKVLIGGFFFTVNGVTRSHIARLNTDGSVDSGFLGGLSGANSSVFSVAVQSDGKVLIGGWFSEVNGVPRPYFARLDSDGTLDGGFQNGRAGIAGGKASIAQVNSLAVQSDGKVLIGGDFTAVNGVHRNRIARLNTDGTLDGGFLNGLSGPDSYVNTVAVQSDGKVFLGGWFSEVNDVGRQRIARLNVDGTLDIGFLNGLLGIAGPINSFDYVNSVAMQSDDKALIGGRFTAVNGENRSSIARLNTDGTLDSGFQNGLFGTVQAVAVQTDGKALIGGRSLPDTNGVVRGVFARLNTDGTSDSDFKNGLVGVTSDDPSAFISSFAMQSDGKVLAGGDFSFVNGASRNVIARLNTDGTLDTGFQNGMAEVGWRGSTPSVNSVAVQSDGKVLIGGNFTTVDGVNFRSGIVRLNSDGTLDSAFQNGRSGTDNTVLSIALQSDGKVLIGGSFGTVNGVPVSGIARLWTSADIPPRVQSINRNGADVDLIWDALPNRTYRLQYKAELSADTWTDLAGDVFATGTSAGRTDMTLGNASQRFYRVRLLP